MLRPHETEQGPYTIANINTTDERQQFNHFLPIKIGQHQCAALIDSGNQWRRVILDGFARRLGIINIVPIEAQPKVTTGQKGAAITGLGEAPTELQLTISHTGKTYPWDMGPQTRRRTRRRKKDEYIQNIVRKAKENKSKEKKFDTSNFTIAQKQKWIMEMFELVKKPYLQSPDNLEAVTKLLLKCWDLFSHDGLYGQSIQHRFLTEDVPPIKC